MRRALPIACLTLAALALASCKVGPDYERPTTELPTQFRSQDAPEERSLADLPWWEVYRDERLQDLIRVSLENNYDLRIAISRVEQARQIALQSRSLYFPTVNYQGGISGGRNEFQSLATPNGGQTEGSASALLSATWEIDLWGRIRRLNEAALAQFLATEEARRGVTLTLESDVAQAYFELLELDLELVIAHRTAVSFEGSLRLFSQRLTGGAGSKLETSRAEASLAAVTARIPDLERLIILKENQISVLLGRVPGPIERSSILLDDAAPPEVPAGIPSTLLERRPDIREAEQLLRAANANVGVAHADYFPRIGLTTFFGNVSADLDTFFDGSSVAWSVGGALTGPLFSAGRLDAQLAQAKAQWEEARLQYERAVLISLREVADSLTDRMKLADVRREQERSVGAYEEAVHISSLRYKNGKASYFEVLEAQQQLFPAENTLAQTQLNQMLAIVRLYKALGGGWEAEEAAKEEAAKTEGAALAAAAAANCPPYAGTDTITMRVIDFETHLVEGRETYYTFHFNDADPMNPTCASLAGGKVCNCDVTSKAVELPIVCDGLNRDVVQIVFRIGALMDPGVECPDRTPPP